MHDVIVVGAGPGGASAASACASKGLKTLLIDEARFPRYKLCGGGISEAARKLLGFNIPKNIIEREVSAFRLTRRNMAFEFRPGRRLITMVLRDAFDTFLAEKAVDAGADFSQGERATGVRRARDGMEVTTSKAVRKARCVVGADGVNSVLAQHVRPAFGKFELALAVGAEVPAPAKFMEDEFGDTLEIEVGSVHQGYGWIFPKRRVLSFGYVTVLPFASGLRHTLSEYIRKRGFHGNYEVTGHMIPMPGRLKKCWADRLLLVGDAAGFVDPLHGEGIRYAIKSGRLAADVLAEALESDDLSAEALARYGALCREDFMDDFKWARRLSRIIYPPSGLFFWLAECNPSVIENFVETLSGENEYEKFFKWSAPRFPLFMATALGKKIVKKTGIAGRH